MAGDVERGFYELSAWVVMPNHVHLLFLPKVAPAEITRWIIRIDRPPRQSTSGSDWSALLAG
jgi:REP element-mobilizing transposase RayT